MSQIPQHSRRSESASSDAHRRTRKCAARVGRRTASAPKAPPRTRAWSTRRESSAALTSAGHGTRAAGCSSQSMTAAASGSIAHAWRGALTTRAPPRRCPRLQRAPTSGVSKSSPSASDPARPACAAYAAVETHGPHPPRRSRHRPRPRAPRATAPLTGSAARRFRGLRKRPERLQPRAAYPRHRRRRDIGLCPLTRPPAPPRPARRITTRVEE
jgi:hypothetical protein